MTAYTLSASATLRDVGNAAIWGVATARTGSDTVNNNGFNLTIDQDSRYGLSGTTSTTWAALTINATKGGNITIDGRYSRMIPFITGSGTITAGTLITVGSGTGYVVGIYSSLTTAPVLTGIVAAGWIKVAAWNNVAFPTSGTFTQAGYTFTVSGASIVGFVEFNQNESTSMVLNRLGTFSALGEWFELGTTNGIANQTMQCPNNGTLRYLAGIYIETAVGAGTFEFYPNAGPTTTTGTDATRGKVVWIDNTGLVRIGNSGAATNGFLPVTGLRVVVGNVFIEGNLVTTLTANSIPNATIGTRPTFNASGGGVIVMSKVNCANFAAFNQAYSISLTDCGFVDTMTMTEVATPMTLTRVGVGKKAVTELVTTALNMSLCFAGGTFTDCVFAKGTGATAVAVFTLLDTAGFTFTRVKSQHCVITGVNLLPAWNVTRAVNCTWVTPTVIQGFINLITCTNCTINNTIYCSAVSGITVTTYSQYVWQLSTACSNIKIDGLTFPVTSTQPYTALLSIGAAGCANIKMRNIGTYASPLSLGAASVNTGLVYVLASGAAASDVTIQRVYVATTRTGILTADNSTTRVTHESVFGDYADASDVSAILNFKQKGTGGTLALTAQTAIYGTHFADYHTSATVSRIAILMNEPTTLTAAQVTLTNGAAFTSAGGLYMPTIGMTATFETPEYIIGHNSFTNSAAVMAGGTVANYQFEYSIDKNDGNGFSALTSSAYTAALLATALNGLTGINSANGFKLRIKISTTTANITAISSLYLITASTTTSQAYQYPLETITLTLTGLQTGSDIVVLAAGTVTQRINVDSNPTSSYSYVYQASEAVDIGIIKIGYVPLYIRNLTLSTTDSTLPIAQVADRNFI